MKNFNHNSLVRDFVGAAFCLMMAFALLMMYSGCSEDNSPINGAHGGAAEEQGFALVGLASDVYPKLLKVQINGTDSEASLNNDKILKAAEGVPVTLYELDSLTLDTTGRILVDTIDNGDGHFAFKEIDFNSPYVLVEVQDFCLSYNCVGIIPDFPADSMFTGRKYRIPLGAIVDVRKYQKISVNTLSDMKIPLVKKYFAEGMPFDSACKRAELDVLDRYGVYDDLGDFENLESVNGELSYVLRIMRFAKSQNFIRGGSLPISIETHYFVPPAAVAALGEDAERVYANTIKFIDYQIGSFTRNTEIGRCTESRENETQKILGGANDISVICHSNKWVPGWKRVEYTNGTMVDNRDGKTYKTVTYNWGGVTQTWMAENLNYADTASSNADSALKNNLLESTKCWEGDPSCELLGRYYTWRAAMNLGWSDIGLTDVVKNVVYDTVRNDYVESYDTVVVEDRCKTIKYEMFYPQEPKDGPNAIEYCSAKLMSGECDILDTAGNIYEYCDVVYGRSRLDISRFVPETKPVVYQGVCPDGWRLPNKNDWAILQENMHDRGASLKDPYGSGFGYTEMMTIRYNAEIPSLSITNRVYSTAVRFIAVPDRDDGAYSNFFNWLNYGNYLLEAGNTESASSNDSLPWDFTRYQEYGDVDIGLFNEEAPVRCIKN